MTAITPERRQMSWLLPCLQVLWSNKYNCQMEHISFHQKDIIPPRNIAVGTMGNGHMQHIFIPPASCQVVVPLNKKWSILMWFNFHNTLAPFPSLNIKRSDLDFCSFEF